MGRIRKATTAGSRAFICLYSESGGGKTLSALRMARGMVGPTGHIVLVDTENRRGEIYADDPTIGGYDVLPLGEPFSPKAYEDAIKEAEEAGADAIIIDSGSHEWEGPGGVLDMAVIAANGGQPSFGHWNKPKAAHKKMIQRIMRSSAHVIVCLRAQYKARQIEKKDYARYGISSNKNSEIIRDDFQSPIQDASFIFETTVHLYFSNRNPGVPIVTKCPDMLLDAFPSDKLISVATGAKVAAFYANNSPGNQATADLFKLARQTAAKGREEYEAWFTKQIGQDQRRELVSLGVHADLKASFDQVDADDDPRNDNPDPGPSGGDYVPPQFPGGDVEDPADPDAF